MARREVVAFVPLGPPYAGPEVSNSILLKPDKLPFNIHIINTSYQQSNAEKGHITRRSLGAWAKNLYRLLRTLVSVGPDVFYFNLSATPLGLLKDWVVVSLAAPFSARVVGHARGGHYGRLYREGNPLVKLLALWTWNRCHRILVQSEGLKGQFKGVVPEYKLGVVPNPAPEEFFRITPKYGERVVLFVGHRSVAKGWTTLLAAVPRIVERFPDVRFLVMGTEIEEETNITWAPKESVREAWKRYVVDEGLEDRFRIYEDVFGEAKLRIYSSASVFVLPSYSEGFSMAVLEAMASGLPVITTPVGALPEVLPPSTPFVQPGDVEGLVEALSRLLESETLRMEMGRLNREAALRFHEDRVRGIFARELFASHP
ncbi:MAG: glycosyltransferase family 4 protein [Thermotogae bacterium]|nr:glycosyltransferase family 4 protein [Thermotogota bacterium]